MCIRDRIRAHVELAATIWLDEINKINRGLAEQHARIKKERDEATRLDAELDRVAATAETSRTMAEAAEAACRAAQLGIVEPDSSPGGVAIGTSAADRMEARAAEQAAGRDATNAETDMTAVAPPAVVPPPLAAPPPPAAPPPLAAPPPAAGPPPAGADEPAAVPAPLEPKVDYGGSRSPTIVRLLRRDRAAMNLSLIHISEPTRPY